MLPRQIGDKRLYARGWDVLIQNGAHCGSRVQVVRVPCFEKAPAFLWGKHASERRGLAQLTGALAIFRSDRQRGQDPLLQELGPGVEQPVVAAGCAQPAIDVFGRDHGKRGFGADLVGDQAVHRQAAAVESFMRTGHGFHDVSRSSAFVLQLPAGYSELAPRLAGGLVNFLEVGFTANTEGSYLGIATGNTMSYDEHDAAMDEMYDRIGDEAIREFTADRLKSYYLANPMVMRPAVDALQEAKRLKANGHHSAAVVFCATTIELLLKATLLQPIIYGLVHNEGLADIIVKYAAGQTGFDRYRNLLSQLFQELANLDISSVRRDGASVVLIDESRSVQSLRNDIIHKGQSCGTDAAENAFDVAVAVFDQIVVNVLWSIGLSVGEKGHIGDRQFT